MGSAHIFFLLIGLHDQKCVRATVLYNSVRLDLALLWRCLKKTANRNQTFSEKLNSKCLSGLRHALLFAVLGQLGGHRRLAGVLHSQIVDFFLGSILLTEEQHLLFYFACLYYWKWLLHWCLWNSIRHFVLTHDLPKHGVCSPGLEKIPMKRSLHIASVCGMKSVITLLKTVVLDWQVFSLHMRSSPGVCYQSITRILSASEGVEVAIQICLPWVLRLVFIHHIRMVLELVLIWQASQILLWNNFVVSYIYIYITIYTHI